MSDEEIFDDDIINNLEDDDDEHDTVLQQELIALVKANPALYAKNWKEYAGKDFCRDLAWESIGFHLSKQMSGKDATKIWYNIRQRFGREGKAESSNSSQREIWARSKASIVPKWKFYDLCSFLVDHIMPRKTVSNYSLKKIVNKTTTEKNSYSPLLILPSSTSSSLSRSTPSPQILLRQAPSPQAPSPQAPSPQILLRQAPSPQTPSPQTSVLLSPSSIWSMSDLEFSNDASMCSIENNMEKEGFIHTSTLSSNLNVEECSSAAVNAPKEVLKSMQRISTKRTIPEPDNFVKRKKKEDEIFMQAITKQSTALTSFAKKIGE
ncbi:uncharacterized protein [Mycetomoellerius zeteki]|uniref:uncharacterized protein n=1 Tax=Mycetomoellerius zeteki TaxID=64791 RepID=UPI00084E3A88|nr:PREDICTED: uncharacterized protein LOC108730475 [Trachymyrmex zeteki]